MRRALSFDCDGSALAATLDAAAGTTGLLIVSGGNEVRSGAHRGLARLAADVAAAGHPVFRFDRRGVGDSAGDNRGFRYSGADLAAALAAFRHELPRLTRVIGFGNCDAATALVLHATPVDARVLANPWVIAPVDALPPPAAIKARYVARVRDPAAWRALLTGQIDMKLLAKGLGRLAASRPPPLDSLADKTVRALEVSPIPTTILLAGGDATALAFAEVWPNDPRIPVVRLDSTSHSFATQDDYSALFGLLTRVLAA